MANNLGNELQDDDDNALTEAGGNAVDNALFARQSGSYIYTPAPERIRVDSYVVSDQFFFFNNNGTVTATI